MFKKALHRKNILNLRVCSLGILLLCSCAHSISLKSIPLGAEVYEINDKGEIVTRLGVTPLKLSTSTKSLRIQKNGYSETTLILPQGPMGLRGDVTVTLLPFSKDILRKGLLEIDPSLLNETVNELLDLQSAVNERRSTEAENLIKKMKDRYDSVVFFHLLAGYHYYQRKDLKSARDSFSHALLLDPKNTDARTMLAVLEGKKR